MSIIRKLASSLDRRDETPNEQLAEEIVKQHNESAVKELISLLTEKNKNIQHDAIKVLYEIGTRNPSLISGYTTVFLDLLQSSNNRLQWGGMTALAAIVKEQPVIIYKNLPTIISAAEKGSVITKDQCMNIVICLYSSKKHADDCFPLLAELLLKSFPNQLPMYAEQVIPVIAEKNKKKVIQILSSRLKDIEKDTKRKRVEKVIKQLS